jgi:peptidylprolyl isomerase
MLNTMYLRRLLLLTIILSLLNSSSRIKSGSIVLIETRLGSININLYDDTPSHRNNFIKLIKSGFYDSLLFHRVIKDFMIQGGDPNSKNAAPGVILGDGDVGYTLPAEILPNHFHYRGVIAAAREGDDANPARRSSGAQFYIVVGKKFTEEELMILQTNLNQRSYQILLTQIIRQLSDSLTKFSIQSRPDSIRNLAIKKATNIFKPICFSNEQKKAYTEIGGVPHLDGAYTIFGEVIKGIEVVEKISLLPTDSNNRPIEDLRMHVKIIQ